MRVVGTRGFTGKRTMNSHTAFNTMFSVADEMEQSDDTEFDVDKLDQLETLDE